MIDVRAYLTHLIDTVRAQASGRTWAAAIERRAEGALEGGSNLDLGVVADCLTMLREQCHLEWVLHELDRAHQLEASLPVTRLRLAALSVWVKLYRTAPSSWARPLLKRIESIIGPGYTRLELTQGLAVVLAHVRCYEGFGDVEDILTSVLPEESTHLRLVPSLAPREALEAFACELATHREATTVVEGIREYLSGVVTPPAALARLVREIRDVSRDPRLANLFTRAAEAALLAMTLRDTSPTPALKVLEHPGVELRKAAESDIPFEIWQDGALIAGGRTLAIALEAGQAALRSQAPSLTTAVTELTTCLEDPTPNTHKVAVGLTHVGAAMRRAEDQYTHLREVLSDIFARAESSYIRAVVKAALASTREKL